MVQPLLLEPSHENNNLASFILCRMISNVLEAFSSIIAESPCLFGQQAATFSEDTSNTISTNKKIVKQQNSTDVLLCNKSSAWANPDVMNDLDWGLVNVVRFLVLNCAFSLSQTIYFRSCSFNFVLEKDLQRQDAELSSFGMAFVTAL